MIIFFDSNGKKCIQSRWSIECLYCAFFCGAGYRNNGTAENSALCKTTLFFPDKYQNYTNDKMCIRKTESDFGKCCQTNWTQKTNWLRSLLIDLNYVRNQLLPTAESHYSDQNVYRANSLLVENHRLLDSMPNRENETQAQAYTMTNSVVVSPNGQSTSSPGMFNTEMGRKPFDFSPDHIQCMCEALQQKGDIEKLAQLLYNLPKSELVRPNDSILRYC